MPEVSPDSIVSRHLLKNEYVDVILFGFAAGQELSEHTSARPAMLYFVAGEAELMLGEERMTAVPHTFVTMRPHLPHSILAHSPVTMLLIMLKNPGN
ncbi:MAG: cupin domain-containing protein [Ardenticatenaceae bacterium]|nr:cupin domain-containing protein [Ardenticatenaceae bacterium]MCB9005702.1 cupin domain-containing protein [Ardenticatenaceae bacterium]